MAAGFLRILALAAGLMAGIAPAAAEPAIIKARPLRQFEVGSDAVQFGRLRFLGGLELSSSDPLFGAWSSLRLLSGGQRFIGIFDTAHWLQGNLERDAGGRLTGLSDVTIDPMRDAKGNPDASKWEMDAEGMALRGDEVLVSFERNHRIDAYPLSDLPQAVPHRSVPLIIPRRSLRSNGGIEAMAVAPEGTPLAGSTVIVSEKSVDSAGNLLAAIVEGRIKGAFTVRKQDGFDVTDAAFLPDGNLLLLERRFTWASGVAMRLRQLAAADIRPGAVVDGEELLRADTRFQIDNMEGIDVFRDADGRTHVILVSDDNHSILQRTLMLEFLLDEDSEKAAL